MIVDDGDLPAAVRAVWPDGADAVLDLVGGPALVESLRVTRPGGVICNTGILGGAWIIPKFRAARRHSVRSEADHVRQLHGHRGRGRPGAPADRRSDAAGGRYDANVDRVFTLDEIVDAHRYMEGSRATGKLVVVV